MPIALCYSHLYYVLTIVVPVEPFNDGYLHEIATGNYSETHQGKRGSTTRYDANPVTILATNTITARVYSQPVSSFNHNGRTAVGN